MDWMAWTVPTALFFAVIAAILVTFTILAIKFPEVPRIGILRIETTRGDRLFITTQCPPMGSIVTKSRLRLCSISLGLEAVAGNSFK